MRCPDGAALAAWIDGEIAGAAGAAVAQHTHDCARCRRAELAQRQVKRRTGQLAGPGPGPGLLSVLLTVPQVEHDRALRRAHLANCGRPGPDGATRVRVAAAGFGAAAVLAVATAMSPAASDDPVQPDPARQSPLESGTNGGNIGGTIGGVGVVNQLGVTSQP